MQETEETQVPYPGQEDPREETYLPLTIPSS